MFRWIIGSSLQYRFVVLAIAAALVFFGVMRAQKMPVDVFPEFALPTVEVQTEAIGLSAREVESLITLNLEELLAGVPWLRTIRSKSVTGLSSIVLTFEQGTDLVRARQMMQERLTLAYTLPNVAHPPVILQPLSATSRFMMVGLSSDTIDLSELSLIARWTIKPKLIGVPGVANVAVWGQRLRQMHVHIDPDRLRDARIMQDDVIATAGDALWVSPLTFLKGSAPGTGGWIDNRNQRIGVHHQMPITTPEDMAKIPVGAQHLVMTGRTMALGEVAETTFAHAPLIGDGIVNDRNGLVLVIEKFPNANTLEVTRAVDQALAEMKRGLPGVAMDTDLFRLATYIDDSVTNLAKALVAGAVLLVLAIGAFLFQWRAALVSLVSIPLAVIAALVVLGAMGATINTMVLAGLVLALGIVIDDAVVDTDRLMKRLRERREGDGSTLASIVLESTAQTRGATLYATLIIVLSVLPIFFMGGVAGAFFTPLATAYLLAVVASMVVALALTPGLVLLVFGERPAPRRESPFAEGLRRRYGALVERIIAAPGAVHAGALVALVVAIAAWPLLGHSLLPDLQERDLVVQWSTPAGTSHAETNRVTLRVAKELRGVPGVRNVAAHVGRAITGDQVVGINAAQLWVSLDRQADHDRTIAAVREVVEGYPGIESSVQSYLRDKIGEVLTGTATPLVVRIFGPKPDVLRDKADEVMKAIGEVAGIADVRIEGQVEEPQIHVKVDLERAGKAAVKPGDIRRNSATVFSGLTVGFLFEEQKINDVVVWGAPEARNSLTALHNLQVSKSDRHHVRLGDVADVDIRPTPTVIRHEGIAPYVDVLANVRARDLGSVARDVEARLGRIAFPLEHNPVLLGEFAERQEVERHVAWVVIASIIGIFLLMHASFGNWRLAVVGFLALPAALVGSVFAVLLSGGTVSLGSMVGFLAVLGIAARSSLLLINHYQRLQHEQGLSFGATLVTQGARERITPILASTAAVIVVMLPIIVFGRIPGLEIVQPMAVVIAGGLLASTLYTLFVAPPLCLLVRAGARKDIDLGVAPHHA